MLKQVQHDRIFTFELLDSFLYYGEAGCDGETGCVEGEGCEEESAFALMSAFKTRLTEGFLGSLVTTFTDLVI